MSQTNLKNEKPIEERNPPRRAVRWKCLCRLLVRPLRPNLRTCDLFFLVWWRLWRPNFFQRRLSTTIAQRAFQHGLLATRISKRRDFLTCRSSSTGPSNFLATPSCPVMRTQTIIVKVVYFRRALLWSHLFPIV